MSSPELMKDILRQCHRVASRVSPTGELLTSKEVFLADVGKLIALEFTLGVNQIFTVEEILDATEKAKGKLPDYPST